MGFMHDGIHDTQTHLIAPPFFYEQLRRELLLTQRTSLQFSIIRIEIKPFAQDLQIGDLQILLFAQELTKITRGQDCVARIGLHEFLILLRDSSVAADLLVNRIHSSKALLANSTLSVSTSSVSSCAGESGLELLNRLDQESLSTELP